MNGNANSIRFAMTSFSKFMMEYLKNPVVIATPEMILILLDRVPLNATSFLARAFGTHRSCFVLCYYS